ncbi:hypothetical protein ACFQZR_13670 [Paenibacillus sp. GCM10027629]|uniref:hypothetical protein n=1 Tax=Paenibacillus sp. GCM10027629 TaxID=3273414 RepID=UPI003642B44E
MEHVAAHDGQIGRRVLGRGLFYEPIGDMRAALRPDGGDDAVFGHVLLRYPIDAYSQGMKLIDNIPKTRSASGFLRC